MARRRYKRDANGRFTSVGGNSGKSKLAMPSQGIGTKRAPGGGLTRADSAALSKANEMSKRRRSPGYRESGMVKAREGFGRGYGNPGAGSAADKRFQARTERAAKADTKRAREITKKLKAGGMRPKDVRKAERSLDLIRTRRMRRTDQKLVDLGKSEKFGHFRYQ